MKELEFQPAARERYRITFDYLFLALRALCLAFAIGAFGFVHLWGFAGWDRWIAITGVAVPLTILACWRRGGTLAWLTVMVGLMVFLEGRARADELGMPLHTGDLLHAEQFLFLGITPSHALQSLFLKPGQLRTLDYFSVGIHFSYFFVPYLALLGVWLVNPHSTHRLSQLLVLIFIVSLVIYALLPATPPWLAAYEEGAPKIYRIVHFVVTTVNPETYDRAYQNIGDPNPTAALPSVHFAITFMLFLCSLGKRRLWSILAASYLLAMAWALVYLGEHYVIDLALGALVAWGAWYGYRRFGGRMDREPSRVDT